MKKKIIFLIAAIFFVVGTMFSINMSQQGNTGDIAVMAKANAQINPLCKNGCVAGTTGCFCFISYPQYKEYDWGDNQN